MPHAADTLDGMREIELHDDFWPSALGALASGAPATSLRESWPDLAELLDELEADARREPLLVGLRLATAGRNARLFGVLLGACLARAGVRTLVLDLSSDTRWLEQLLGADFQEGLIDHLRFGVPLERCVRSTALERFSAMSGGAWFLAGSPLDDAPGFRAALDRLRQRHRVVVVTLPPPLETGDGTGIAALCGALLTVEERNGHAPLAGSERVVVRLTGDPEAARDLAHLTHRFLGPLTAVVSGMARVRPAATGSPSSQRQASSSEAPPPRPEPSIRAPERPRATSEPLARPPREPVSAPAALATARERAPAADEELSFLREFEAQSARERPSSPEPGSVVPPTVRTEERKKKKPAPARPPRSRAVVVTIVGVVVAVAAGYSARGMASDMMAWVLGQSRYEPEASDYLPGETIALDQEASAGIPLTLPVDTAQVVADSAAGLAADSTTAAGLVPAAVRPGRPSPYSVHVGSYQTIESGMRLVEQIQAAGLAAFLAPVALPGKGQWQRVYVGSFADSTSARRALDRLQQDEIVEEGMVRSTPWAFDLGTYPTREAARAEGESLARKGITVYVAGDGPARLYAGAYQTREEAELFASTLATALEGRIATLTLREE
jgi:cell division protein FtsN